MHWRLAGTANTVTFLHINSDDFSTFVQVIAGKKIWEIYRQSLELPLSSVNVFLDEKFLLNEIPNSETYGLEAIVLRPGDFL